MKKCWLALCAIVLPALTGCDPNLYDTGDSRYPPPDYRYPSSYDRGYDRYPDRPYYGHDYDRDRDHDHYDRDHYDRDHYDRDDRHHPRDHDYRPPPPPPPPRHEPEEVRPSCPSGTTFDGRHCIINDKSKIKPGHKGTVNACPNGMYLSGDHCVSR
ncbi:MAG: hypothetical protein U0136_19415 [Bdellovibrionota bacterium]